ncbi:MAG: hypothetical protein K6C36_03695 [Clostridia bacterium]|nr:hypothetical protein [Clostridia bacterium]
MEKYYRLGHDDGTDFLCREVTWDGGLFCEMWYAHRKEWADHPDAYGVFIGFISSDEISEKEAMKITGGIDTSTTYRMTKENGKPKLLYREKKDGRNSVCEKWFGPEKGWMEDKDAYDVFAEKIKSEIVWIGEVRDFFGNEI